jgi:bifunctional N-acetylglucosamine-1-phosphate-uridyltransferase/glucosamine-1-phosphate-acetyltransferase GlmU-like protein
VPEGAAEVLVLSGDVPLITAADLVAVLDARREDDAAIALATVFAADPDRLGRVVRSEFGTVERIVEAKDATEEELAGNEVNAGLYVFDAAWLRRRIGSLVPSAATGELYLTELIRLAREDGRLVSAVAFDDDCADGARGEDAVGEHERRGEQADDVEPQSLEHVSDVWIAGKCLLRDGIIADLPLWSLETRIKMWENTFRSRA